MFIFSLFLYLSLFFVKPTRQQKKKKTVLNCIIFIFAKAVLKIIIIKNKNNTACAYTKCGKIHLADCANVDKHFYQVHLFCSDSQQSDIIYFIRRRQGKRLTISNCACTFVAFSASILYAAYDRIWYYSASKRQRRGKKNRRLNNIDDGKMYSKQNKRKKKYCCMFSF